MSTNTPRTDAKCNDYAGPLSFVGDEQFLPASFARKLERELAEANAEVERLKAADSFSKRELARGNEIIDGLRQERDQLSACVVALEAAKAGKIAPTNPAGGVCQECGKVDDMLRPYGKGGKPICFYCTLKDEDEAKRQIEAIATRASS